MRAAEAEIELETYVDMIADVLDTVVPHGTPLRIVLGEIVRTLVLAYYDNRALRQSDLDSLYAAFCETADMMES